MVVVNIKIVFQTITVIIIGVRGLAQRKKAKIDMHILWAL